MLKAKRHNGHRFNDLDAMLLDRLNDVTCSSKCLTYAQVQIMFSLAGGICKWAADNDVIMSKSDSVYAELTYLFDEFAGDCFKYTTSMDSTRSTWPNGSQSGQRYTGGSARSTSTITSSASQCTITPTSSNIGEQEHHEARSNHRSSCSRNRIDLLLQHHVVQERRNWP